MNRLFDIIVAVAILILTLPLWLATLVVVPLSDFGSPLFLHQRVGRDGKLFKLIKFRTMRRRSESGLNLTVAGDKRVTGIGRLLRRLKIDELPQLANVLAGSMSIIGPRPETPEFVALFTEEQRQILQYRPGLTDPASIKYRHEELILANHADPVAAYRNIVLPDKIAISLAYQQKRTLLSDLGVIGDTVAAIFGKASD